MDRLKIIFAGTPDFSVPALKALIDSEHQVIAVYTQPDRPAGRGRKLTPSPVKSCALDADIPVYQPLSLKKDEAQQDLSALQADLMVVVAYGLILPQTVLDAPRLGCWNIHASLLPRWRGAAPIQRAILAGDAETGVCIMQMDAGLDTGDVLLRSTTPISEDDTSVSLHQRLSDLGAKALMDALAGRETLAPQPQPEEGVVYAHKLEKSESVLDWQQPAVELSRKIRAFNPWPGAQLEIGGQLTKIWQADVDSAQGAPGQVLQAKGDDLVIATGEQSLRITELQRPGSRRMAVRDYLNAQPLPVQ